MSTNTTKPNVETPPVDHAIDWHTSNFADEWTVYGPDGTTTVRVEREHPHAVTVFRTVHVAGEAVLDTQALAELRRFHRGELPEHAAAQLHSLHDQTGALPCR